MIFLNDLYYNKHKNQIFYFKYEWNGKNNIQRGKFSPFQILNKFKVRDLSCIYLFYLKNVDQSELVYGGDLNNYDAIYAWTNERCISIVREITFENAEVC